MSKAKDNVKDLLAAIHRQTPQAADPSPVTQTEKTVVPQPASSKAPESAAQPPIKKSKAGKPATFWMHDEDRQLVRELSAWLAGQGVRPSDSMVIRAALRYSKVGGGFLQAYREASKLDARLADC